MGYEDFKEFAFSHLVVHDGELLSLFNLDDGLFVRLSANLPVQISGKVLNCRSINHYVRLYDVNVKVSRELVDVSADRVACFSDSEHTDHGHFFPALRVVLCVVITVNLHKFDAVFPVREALRHLRPA